MTDFNWFHIDNLNPFTYYGYPSTVDERLLEIDLDNIKTIRNLSQNIISTFDSLRNEAKKINMDNNKIAIGCYRKDTHDIIYVGYYDSIRTIGLGAHNRDGASPKRIWDNILK